MTSRSLLIAAALGFALTSGGAFAQTNSAPAAGTTTAAANTTSGAPQTTRVKHGHVVRATWQSTKQKHTAQRNTRHGEALARNGSLRHLAGLHRTKHAAAAKTHQADRSHLTQTRG